MRPGAGGQAGRSFAARGRGLHRRGGSRIVDGSRQPQPRGRAADHLADAAGDKRQRRRMAVGCYGIERKRVGDSTGPLSIA